MNEQATAAVPARSVTGEEWGGSVKMAATGQPDTESRLRDCHLQVLKANARHGAIPFILASVGFGLVFFHHAMGPAYAMWLIGLCAVSVIRAGFVLRYWPDNGSAGQRGANWNAALLGALGCLYGFTPVWMPGIGSFWFIATVNLWVIGVAFAVLLSQGIVLKAGLAFAIPAVVPLLGYLLLSGEATGQVIGAVDLILMAYLYSIVRRTRATIIEETQHRVRSERLARHHDEQRRRSDRLVTELTEEIERRKIAEAALRRARDEAEHMSNQDHLTSLANRRVFDRELSRYWSEGARSGSPISLIVCDVDLFRSYNEYYGSYAGDRALVMIGNIIERSLAGKQGLASRESGDQFSVLLPQTTENEALEVAESMRIAIHELTLLHPGADAERVVTGTFGVATLVPSDAVVENDLVAAADHALRRAKRCGGNCVFAIYGDIACDER